MKRINLLIVILTILVIFTLIFYIVSNKVYKNKVSRVEGIYSYFETSDLDSCNGLVNYSDKKVSFDDLDDETKLCIAYKKVNKDNMEILTAKKDKKNDTCTIDKMVFRVDEKDTSKCDYKKINLSSLNDEYHKIFGKDIESSVKSFQADNYNICYLRDKDVYCGLSKTFTYIIGSDINIYRSIEKINEKGSSIEIYDYFLKVDGDECYYYYTSDSTNSSCSALVGNKKKIDYKFIKKYGTLYKHTYEKDDNDTYHWISSEPITK